MRRQRSPSASFDVVINDNVDQAQYGVVRDDQQPQHQPQPQPKPRLNVAMSMSPSSKPPLRRSARIIEGAAAKVASRAQARLNADRLLAQQQRQRLCDMVQCVRDAEKRSKFRELYRKFQRLHQIQLNKDPLHRCGCTEQPISKCDFAIDAARSYFA